MVVAAVLKESPHRPDIPLIKAAELQAVSSDQPAYGVASFDQGVPRMHRCGCVAVSDGGVSLYVEVGRAPSSWSAEADTLDSKLTGDVVFVCALCGVVHTEARDGDCRHIEQCR